MKLPLVLCCVLVATPALAADKFKVVTVGSGDLAAELKKHVAAAKKDGLKPFVEFTADWCKPCVAVKKYLHDPLMEDAFAGVYLIQVEFDAFDEKQLTKAGFSMRGIPTFFEVDAKAKPTGRQLASDVWGADVPKNMAPHLKKFFSPQ